MTTTCIQLGDCSRRQATGTFGRIRVTACWFWRTAEIIAETPAKFLSMGYENLYCCSRFYSGTSSGGVGGDVAGEVAVGGTLQ
jgi:hypothetical protein